MSHDAGADVELPSMDLSVLEVEGETFTIDLNVLGISGPEFFTPESENAEEEDDGVEMFVPVAPVAAQQQ